VYTEVDRNRFFDRISGNRNLDSTDCWFWNGSFSGGYPKFRCNDKLRVATRVSYEMFHNLELKHTIYKTCQHELCVNPHHMLLKGTAEYFWFKVVVGEIHECWHWIDGSTAGYGMFRYEGTQILVHRLAYHLYYGIKDETSEICHTCNNTLCCNPHHLFEGTHRDTMKNKVIKGRQPSKLTNEEVYEIKYNHPGTSMYRIAENYNVKQSTIWNIINNKTWRHI